MKNIECPLPRYYMCHAVISLAIALLIWPVLGIYAGLAAGVAFYAGREIAQWQSGLPFDWKGIAAPVAVNLTILLAYIYWVA